MEINKNFFNFFKKLENYPLFIIFIATYVLRFFITEPESFKGNFFTTILFIFIFLSLTFYLFSDKSDLYIMTWLSFYFATPIIKLPFTKIGSLGLLLTFFLPFMFLRSFDFFVFNKYINKEQRKKFSIRYQFLLFIFILYLIINISEADFRTIFSDLIEIITPFVFILYVIKNLNIEHKAKILNFVVLVSVFYLPLILYEIILQPNWGGIVDWRGYRIFGNLFWHNSYAFYLVAPILIIYSKIRYFFVGKKAVFNLNLENKLHNNLQNTFSNEFLKNISLRELFLKLFILVFMLFFTYSRNGYLTLIFTLLFYESVLNQGFKFSKKKFFIILFIVLMLFSYWIYSTKFSVRLRPETIDERTEIWQSIIPLIKVEPIFGYGLGSYELFRENFTRSLSSHNYYLFLLFTSGLIGLLFVLIFIFIFFKEFNQEISKEEISFYKNYSYLNRDFFYSELGMSILFSILFYSIFGNSAFTHVVALNSWILIGVCLKGNVD
ncbi:MAG: O-antigen ligase family protein [Candidatus Woesearchaeota archaeon]